MKASKWNPADVLMHIALVLASLGVGLLGMGRFGPALFKPPLVFGYASVAMALFMLVYRQFTIRAIPVPVRLCSGRR